MSDISLITVINSRLQSLESAVDTYKTQKNDLVRDAIIFRLQRAVGDVLALMHAMVSEEEECECASLEELLESVRESELIDENEEEALLDIIRAVEALAEASDEATINEIMGYVPMYVKALKILVQKCAFDEAEERE